MAYRILLVEDDEQITEIIQDYFEGKGGGLYQIECVGTGEEGRRMSTEYQYDLVLLDVMLPGVDGYTLCREIRRDSDVPVIFLTARHDEDDRLHGYHLGCDDYIAKPFSLAELYAKVTALIKRAKGTIRNDSITAGAIQLDPYRCTVSVYGREVTLAPMEFAILHILMESCGRIVSRDSLLVRIWGYDFDGNERVLDNHVKKLRKALGPASRQITTVIKRGYKLEER